MQSQVTPSNQLLLSFTAFPVRHSVRSPCTHTEPEKSVRGLGILFLLLLTSSTLTCLQHFPDHVQRLFLGSVHALVRISHSCNPSKRDRCTSFNDAVIPPPSLKRGLTNGIISVQLQPGGRRHLRFGTALS